MNTYTWNIEQLDCAPSADGQTNVVNNIHWRIKGTDGTNTADVYGCQALTFDAQNAFINYADLTKEVVLAWAQETMGANAVTRLQESIDKQLSDLATPKIVSPPLPWLA